MTAVPSRILGEDAAPEAAGLVFAPLEETDATELLVHFGDPRVVEFLDIDPLGELDEARAIIAWAKELRDRASGLRWSVRNEENGAFMGTCGFNTLRFEHAMRGEVAYDLSVAWWGQGVMEKIMPALIGYGLEVLDLHRFEARVTPGNHRSCAVLERHGFAREGMLRGYGFWKGQWQDQILFARLAGEEG